MSRSTNSIFGPINTRKMRSLCLLTALLCTSPGFYPWVYATPDNPADRQFTFAWPYAEGSQMAPRGGTTSGPELSLDKAPTAEWVALQEPALAKFERDRRAILAMAGPYRASFDFLETHGFDANYEPPPPYQSWGTEYVYVIADETTRISLQHILVMVIRLPDGTLSEPHVVKHWRQDWHYEDRDLREYRGHQQWAHKRLSRGEAQGTWTQAVFQVDDSPRYESFGKWSHTNNVSTWLSAETWRPLPRREFSVRDDYDVLVGTNRHTITPTGWVHEEANRKVALTSQGEPEHTLAVEAGFNRYERIANYDFSAGDAYWQRTSSFWREVRSAWSALYARTEHFRILAEVDGAPLFRRMFEAANESRAKSTEEMRREIEALLSDYTVSIQD